MRILLLGKNGQLGWELQRSLSPVGELLALDRHGGATLGGTELKADLSQHGSLTGLIERVAPDVIVNAAAHTAVDRAESEPELAHTVNAISPGVLAQAAARQGALLLHYSTDYVFDGSGEHARSEAEPTAPLSVYGRSKCAGEEAIRASGCRHLILRTSWVHAARGGNFAKTMLKLAQTRDELRVIDDQIGAPTGADLLADVSAHLVRSISAKGTGGTYHLCASGHTSWHGYARHVLAWAQTRGLPLRVGFDAVQAVPSSAYPTAAKRPLNSRLSCAKLQADFGLVLPPWQQGVDRMLTETLAL